MIVSLNSQVLGVHAFGSVSGDGLVKNVFGCDIVRTGLGTYEMRLPPEGGLDPKLSYLYVCPKQDIPVISFVVPSIQDSDPFVKTILMTSPFDNTFADSGFIAILFRSEAGGI